MKPFSEIKGDLAGALAAAIITLPMSIGYGMIAYSPLGMDFAPTAALLGIYSAVLCCFISALLGGTPIQISGPKAPLTLAFGAVVAKLAFDANATGTISIEPSTLIGLASLTIFIAGISQLVFGALGLGNIVKYVPQPVVSGFMNGIAFLLIIKQIKPLMGLDNKIPFVEIISNPNLIEGLALLVGITTIIAILLSKKYLKIVPASLVGVVVGTAIYYIIVSFLEVAPFGAVIGPIQSGWPKPYLLNQFSTQLNIPNFHSLFPYFIISGLVIGLIGSMESLLSAVVSDNLTSLRHNSKKELIGQGFGNIASSIFGALPGAGSIPRSTANFRSGGRTRLSGMLCGLIILLLVTFCGPLFGKIPLAVIAGIIIVVGYSLFDRWSFNLIKKIFSSKGHRKAAFVNLSVATIVTIVTISINLIAAVVIGIIISSALFISRVGKSIIRRQYSADQFHSRKMRNKAQTEILEKMGAQISVVELQGPLFFGSAEHLSEKIDHLLKNCITYFILDMKRISEIDSTGANIILRIKKRVELENRYFLVSNLKNNIPLWEFLEAMDVSKTLDMDNVFIDTDSALEWAEDHLLHVTNSYIEKSEEVLLSQVDLLQNLSEVELETFTKSLITLKFKKGEKIIEEGDDSRDLYLLKSGSMTVKMHLPGRKCYKRLYTYSPGIVFGEIALLDGGKRSAGIWAHEDTEVLKLPYECFQRLQNEQSEIAIKLIHNIAVELSNRLRRISNQLRLLEDQC
jgi:MFS superfamily sulfate permease-like transporter